MTFLRIVINIDHLNESFYGTHWITLELVLFFCVFWSIEATRKICNEQSCHLMSHSNGVVKNIYFITRYSWVHCQACIIWHRSNANWLSSLNGLKMMFSYASSHIFFHFLWCKRFNLVLIPNMVYLHTKNAFALIIGYYHFSNCCVFLVEKGLVLPNQYLSCISPC